MLSPMLFVHVWSRDTHGSDSLHAHAGALEPKFTCINMWTCYMSGHRHNISMFIHCDCNHGKADEVFVLVLQLNSPPWISRD